jgi:hypothetical protein
MSLKALAAADITPNTIAVMLRGESCGWVAKEHGIIIDQLGRLWIYDRVFLKHVIPFWHGLTGRRYRSSNRFRDIEFQDRPE